MLSYRKYASTIYRPILLELKQAFPEAEISLQFYDYDETVAVLVKYTEQEPAAFFLRRVLLPGRDEPEGVEVSIIDIYDLSISELKTKLDEIVEKLKEARDAS